MRNPLRRRPDYSPEEIAEMIGNISILMKQRGQAQQLAILEQAENSWHEVQRFDEAIETAQLVLRHMLERTAKQLKS